MDLNGHKTHPGIVNHEVLRRVNHEVSLKATRFANALLSGVFRAVFRVEQSFEFAEPEIYELDHEPQRIMWNRLDDWWVAHLPQAIATERVLAARYHQFTEYDFIVVADISHSMMLRWWDAYGGEPLGKEAFSLDSPDFQWQTPGDRTKLFLLKYTLISFVRAACANKFFSVVMLFGNDTIRTFHSRQEPNLGETLLKRIDGSYENMVQDWRGERPLLPQALRRVLARRRRSIVLCISDFMDTLQCINEERPRLTFEDVMLPLAEIASHHRLLVLRINESKELEPAPQKDSTADLRGHECHDGERPDARGGGYSESAAADHVDRVKIWQAQLDEAFARYGIRTQQIVAQRDDEQVDRVIYNLGAQTWS